MASRLHQGVSISPTAGRSVYRHLKPVVSGFGFQAYFLDFFVGYLRARVGVAEVADSFAFAHHVINPNAAIQFQQRNACRHELHSQP